MIARERQAANGVKTQLSLTRSRSQGSMISARPAVAVHAVAGKTCMGSPACSVLVWNLTGGPFL